MQRKLKVFQNIFKFFTFHTLDMMQMWRNQISRFSIQIFPKYSTLLRVKLKYLQEYIQWYKCLKSNHETFCL